MKRYQTEKKERSLGVRLFLKAERCNSPKCALIRRASRPGMHGKKRKTLSEYGRQLKEKQKIQVSYGLTETQMRRLFKEMLIKKLLSGRQILSLIERRLDNVVMRLGFAASRALSRQIISHGHILLNGRRVRTPSTVVSIGDKITIKKESLANKLFTDIDLKLKNLEPPSWLALDKEKKNGEIKGYPEEDADLPFDLNLVMEYYSR